MLPVSAFEEIIELFMGVLFLFVICGLLVSECKPKNRTLTNATSLGKADQRFKEAYGLVASVVNSTFPGLRKKYYDFKRLGSVRLNIYLHCINC